MGQNVSPDSVRNLLKQGLTARFYGSSDMMFEAIWNKGYFFLEYGDGGHQLKRRSLCKRFPQLIRRMTAQAPLDDWSFVSSWQSDSDDMDDFFEQLGKSGFFDK